MAQKTLSIFDAQNIIKTKIKNNMIFVKWFHVLIINITLPTNHTQNKLQNFLLPKMEN